MPTMQDLRLQVYYRLVAAALLGPDAAWGTLPFVHPLPPLQQFISQCIVYMWHLQKRHVEKECQRLDAEVASADAVYEGNVLRASAGSHAEVSSRVD